MWEGGVGDSEFNKRLPQALSDEEKFRISAAVKAALEAEIRQWLKKLMPHAKDDAIDFEVNFCIGLAYDRFEDSIDTSRKLKSMDSMGDGSP